MVSVLVQHSAAMTGEWIRNVLREDPVITVLRTTAGRRGPQVGAADVVIADLQHMRRTGRAGGHAISTTRYLAVTAHDAPSAVAESLHLGAHGVLSDRSAADDVSTAVHRVADGQGWVAPELATSLLADYTAYRRRRTHARRQVAVLSVRDRELLARVGEGWTNAQIADDRHLALSTVKEYVGQVLAGLGLTRAEAIALATLAELSLR